LNEATSLADIGCGLGHWSRLLYPYLRPPARLVGIDREPQWVATAAQNFRDAFPEVAPELITFVAGDALELPLPDNSCDVVTCQTVLMHLPQPLRALREMLRVLRPGGLLVCVEPNNLWNYLGFTSLTAAEEVAVLVRRFEFWLRYHRGLVAEGRGDHTIGDLLPGYFAELGLSEITVHQSDRAASVFPPYASPEQLAVIEQERQAHRAACGPWDRDELRRCIQRGGGNEELIETAFRELEEKFEREQQAIRSEAFHAASGGLFYLVSGRKH
jgi:SAM-dependent methyltransferase